MSNNKEEIIKTGGDYVMQHLKRYKAGFICVLLLAGLYYGRYLPVFAHYPFAHFYPYHHKGTIHLTIDGDSYTIQDIPLYFYSDAYFYGLDNAYETVVIENDGFELKTGAYGGNVLIFTLPHADYPILEEKDVKVLFGQFNANNWYVNQYEIHMDVVTDGIGASVVMSNDFGILSIQERHNIEQKIDITNEQNVVNIYKGP